MSREFDPRRHHRRSIRLQGYDYAQPGAYFVTVCTHHREMLFGEVVNDIVRLNTFGQIVREEWFRSAEIRREIELYPDEFVVMPNHIHGIVWIVEWDGTNVGASGRSPLHDRPFQRPRGPAPRSLASFVAGFKSAVTRCINHVRGSLGTSVWQRNYWEHVIRTERVLNAIRQYIHANPSRWSFDRYNPHAIGSDPVGRELWAMLRQVQEGRGGEL